MPKYLGMDDFKGVTVNNSQVNQGLDTFDKIDKIMGKGLEIINKFQNLAELKAKMQPAPQGSTQEIKVNKEVENRVQQIQEQNIMKVQPKIFINGEKAVGELWNLILSLDETKTIKDAKEELAMAKEMGLLKGKVEEWIMSNIEVKHG